MTATHPAPVASPPNLAPTSDSLISIRGLTKYFPARRRWRDVVRRPWQTARFSALSELDCDIRAGEFFGLLGVNGAGKSTLFRVLSTMITPDAGHVRVGELDLVDDAQMVRRRVALVTTDERSLDWRLSARENLRFYASLHGHTGLTRSTLVDEVLAIVALLDAGDRMVGQYSSGMKQRLLIGRALVARPDVLLLDEPTRSLDPLAARRFRQFLKQDLVGIHGCTVLLATHNAEEALELCDRVAILHRGELVAVDDPQEFARMLGNERFQVWTRTPDHPAFVTAVRSAAVSALKVLPSIDGWAILEFDIPHADVQAVNVLQTLVCGGAEIGRFSRIQPALADVMEHVLGHRIHGGSRG